jgi:methanogenic corrinoid protein MtbC1
MRKTYRDPVFNLKAVTEKTGVTSDTLRAWERRYGLPQPERTKGGHRIYSQRDIDIIKWLVARREEGLRISRAVKLYRKLEEKGQSPLVPAPSTSEVTTVTGDAITELRQTWISALLSFDRKTAEQAITQAFALYPPALVCLEVLQTGIVEIGQGWYEGRITVQQEHFASKLTTRRLESMIRATPPPTRPDRILVACPPGEEHTFGLDILAFLLRRSGWDVLQLGANVPQRKMKETIEAIEPRLVILAAQQLHTAANLLRMIQALQSEDIALAFGGGIFHRLPSLQDYVPASFLGSSIEKAGQVVEQLMKSPPPSPAFVKTASQIYREALSHYRDRHPLLEAEVWEILRDKGINYEPLEETNRQFTQAITGALSFGDIALLDSHLVWLEGMHSSIRVSTEILSDYLDAYHQATEVHLDERGKPIRDWLSKRNKRNASNSQTSAGMETRPT